jgi:hypothetical protein
VQVKALVMLEPTLHGWGLVSGIVVDDQMQVETGRGLPVDRLEEPQDAGGPIISSRAVNISVVPSSFDSKEWLLM